MRRVLVVLAVGCGSSPHHASQPAPAPAPAPVAVAPAPAPAPPAPAPVAVEPEPDSSASAPSVALRPHEATIPSRALTRDNSIGGLSADDIRKIIRAHIRRLSHCYELQHDPPPTSATGIRTSFTIGPDGGVTAAKFGGVAPEVATCLENVVRSMRFPKPSDGGSVVITYPFNVDAFP